MKLFENVGLDVLNENVRGLRLGVKPHSFLCEVHFYNTEGKNRLKEQIR